MNRINPEDVLSAYQQIDMVPITGDWYQERWNDNLEATEYCCCGLTAVAIARGMIIFDDDLDDDDLGSIEQEVRSKLKIDANYTLGFVRGFDGIDIPDEYYEGTSEDNGVLDGNAARNLLIEKGYL